MEVLPTVPLLLLVLIVYWLGAEKIVREKK